MAQHLPQIIYLPGYQFCAIQNLEGDRWITSLNIDQYAYIDN